MPQRAKRPCSHQPCPNLVDSGYCERHQLLIAERRRREQNDDPMRPFYKNKRWFGTRLVVLARCNHICEKCRNAIATIVHHVVDARVWVARNNDFYDESNLVGWCESCHNEHTATQQHYE